MKRIILAALICISAPLYAGEEAIQLQDGAGRDMAASRCAICHSLDYIEMNAPVQDRGGWQKTIKKMVDKFGAPITADEAKQIEDYLATHYSRHPDPHTPGT
jgi:mono/diheme cytochrome c family protein